MVTSTISVNKQTVKELLETGKNNPFVIPEYQRPYEWSDDQVVTLFEDLWNFAMSQDEEGKSKTYFLGTIVSYENDKGEQEIIDGQQRITSLFLLLRAIYTKLQAQEVKGKETTNFINQIEPAIWRTDKFTGEVDYSDILIDSRVINNKGNETFLNILKNGETEEGASDNYSKNYNKFMSLFETKSKDEALNIYEFIYAILNQAIVFPIKADTQDTALIIFSTLNDRGLPLSDADIFKAKIYGKISKEKKQQFIEAWKDLDDKAKYVGETIQSLFYYYMFYLRALEGDDKTTTPGLRKYYAGEGNKFTRLNDTTLLDDLKKILNIWLVVNKNEIIETEKWSKDKDIIKILDILNSYPNEFWKYPVIIYYLKYNQEEGFEIHFLRFLRKLLVDLLKSFLETPTINAVKGSIMKLNLEIIKSNRPVFDFKTISGNPLIEKIKVPYRNAVRMMLKLIAYEEQDDLLPDKWEIEHIFPQKWQTNYFVNLSDDIIKEKIEHIGNKTPFEKKLNIIAGNGYFGKKKEQYKESKIIVTKKFSETEIKEWGLDNINERDIRISDLIICILEKWDKEYQSIDGNTKNEPTSEQLAMIEEFKKKGWV